MKTSQAPSSTAPSNIERSITTWAPPTEGTALTPEEKARKLAAEISPFNQLKIKGKSKRYDAAIYAAWLKTTKYYLDHCGCQSEEFKFHAVMANLNPLAKTFIPTHLSKVEDVWRCLDMVFEPSPLSNLYEEIREVRQTGRVEGYIAYIKRIEKKCLKTDVDTYRVLVESLIHYALRGIDEPSIMFYVLESTREKDISTMRRFHRFIFKLEEGSDLFYLGSENLRQIEDNGRNENYQYNSTRSHRGNGRSNYRGRNFDPNYQKNRNNDSPHYTCAPRNVHAQEWRHPRAMQF